MTDNPIELAEEAVAYKLLGMAMLDHAKTLTERAGAGMGRGTVYPKLPDGTELACFNVPADALVIDINEALLLPFVEEHFPTEVEMVKRVRPAFVEAVREATRQAKTPAAPRVEDMPPGVCVAWEPRPPRITARTAGKERASAAVLSAATEVLEAFARPQIEGETS